MQNKHMQKNTLPIGGGTAPNTRRPNIPKAALLLGGLALCAIAGNTALKALKVRIQCAFTPRPAITRTNTLGGYHRACLMPRPAIGTLARATQDARAIMEGGVV